MALENDGSQSVEQPAGATGTSEGASSQSMVTPELEAKFAEVFGGDSDSAGASRQRQAEAEQQEELDEARQQDGAENGKAADADDSGEPAPKQPDRAKPDAKDAPDDPAAKPAADALSPMLRHAAQRAGWEKGDIDAFYAQNPALAERTFERLYASFNESSARFAALARGPANAGKPQSAPSAAPVMPPAANNAAVNQLDALYSDAGLKKFGEDNGEDLVEKLLKPLGAEVIQPFRQMKAELEQMRAWVQQQQAETLAREVNLVFQGWEGEFADLYGKNGQVTSEQQATRAQVAQLADQIAAGAAMQGVEIGVSEALERAHAMFTADRRGDIERKRLVAQVKDRTSRITARPTQRKIARTVDDGAARSEKAAMEAVGNFWAERGL